MASVTHTCGCRAEVSPQYGVPVQILFCPLHDAAADLLAALIGVVRVADRATDVFDAARAAIAKATGQTH